MPGYYSEEVPPIGLPSTSSAAFRAFAAKLPPAQRARLEATMRTPAVQAHERFMATARTCRAGLAAELAEAERQIEIAAAGTRRQAEARQATDRRLVSILAKSSRLAADLAHWRR